MRELVLTLRNGKSPPRELLREAGGPNVLVGRQKHYQNGGACKGRVGASLHAPPLHAPLHASPQACKGV